jgi:hypothetical protein
MATSSPVISPERDNRNYFMVHFTNGLNSQTVLHHDGYKMRNLAPDEELYLLEGDGYVPIGTITDIKQKIDTSGNPSMRNEAIYDGIARGHKLLGTIDELKGRIFVSPINGGRRVKRRKTNKTRSKCKCKCKRRRTKRKN